MPAKPLEEKALQFKMLLRSIITEAPTLDDLNAMKSIIAGKIKGLPDDNETVKALREIEDLLKHVNAGGKMGIINGKLQSIKDPSVDKAQKTIARYILGLDMTPDQRDHLFDLWRNDNLVKRDVLLTKGMHNFADIITDYQEPYIKELVNDLMREAALGQGKGEFGLSVLSKNINKQEGKGDLNINGRAIEVKTTDGGAGRFTDQEVRPGAGFEAQATELNKWLAAGGYKLPGSGLSLTSAVDIYNDLDPASKKTFIKMVSNVLKLIFNSKINVSPIVQAIQSGESGLALQEYAKASFNFYIDQKDDDGVLYMNLGTEPITAVYFETADDLTAAKMRLHAGTAYLTSIKDVRLPYPQMDIVPTTFGARAKAEAEAKAIKQAEKERKALARQPIAAPQPKRNVTNDQFQKDVYNSVKTFAGNRGVTDKKTVAQIAAYAMQQITSGNGDPKKLTAKLAKAFPELKAK